MTTDDTTAPQTDSDSDEATKKKSRLPMILGVVLALIGAGGGFYAAWSGLILGPESPKAEMKEGDVPKAMQTAFVPMEPLVISLSSASRAQHLLFRAELEVSKDKKENVQSVLPRVVDVLNSYLRALDPGDLEDPSALTRLRAQMLRRVQIVVGPDQIKDLLVMEFVLK